ncbi:MAG TPA: hypothetical protein DHW22_12985, partial [Planctomycetaceae bacterium]|nr:hypothetical protein [Planctomycetaceae bacterium]
NKPRGTREAPPPFVFCQAPPATIIADDSVSRGGCLVTTEFGSVDLQLETQLSRLAEEMC